MDDPDRQRAEEIGARIASGRHDPVAFRAALLAAPPLERDAWLDHALALPAPPDDGPDLPPGGVPYLPAPVDALLRLVDLLGVGASDVFVDVGSGAGRAAVFVHLLTGAEAIGIEVQSALCGAARELTRRLHLSRVRFVEGDAATPMEEASLSRGSVFLLYCPFGGERLQIVLAKLEAIASTRAILLGCLHLPLPPAASSRLTALPPLGGDLALYRGSPG